MYVARKRLKIGDSWREPGDPVPEAAEWPNLRAYLNGGYVGWVEEPTDNNVGQPPSASAEALLDDERVEDTAVSAEAPLDDEQTEDEAVASLAERGRRRRRRRW